MLVSKKNLEDRCDRHKVKFTRSRYVNYVLLLFSMCWKMKELRAMKVVSPSPKSGELRSKSCKNINHVVSIS